MFELVLRSKELSTVSVEWLGLVANDNRCVF